MGQFFVGLVFAAQQGTSIGPCIEDLDLLAPYDTDEEIASQVIFLLLCELAEWWVCVSDQARHRRRGKTGSRRRVASRFDFMGNTST